MDITIIIVILAALLLFGIQAKRQDDEKDNAPVVVKF